MKSKTEKILWVLRILAWMGMIGYVVTFGSQAISFVVSFSNPSAAKQMPGVNQDLVNLLQYNVKSYVFTMSFVLAISAMFAMLWYQVILLLSKINIKSPFTMQVSKKLETIAYSLLGIWIVACLAENYASLLSRKLGEPINIITINNEFLFIAGIVFIISQIFKQGIEMQEENLQTI